MDSRRMVKLFIPVALMLIVMLLPNPEDLSRDAQTMFAILVFAASIFILQPISLGMSGVVVLVLPLILGVSTPGKVFSTFGNSAVFFLIGAFIIAAAVERTPLHRKVSVLFLRIGGRTPKTFILATMLAGASLSMIMPEHGVIILIIPILMTILVGMGLVGRRSNFARSVMIGAAYGCSIGSIITPLGGARNPLTIAFLSSSGIEISFLKWMAMSGPIAIISMILVWLALIFIFPPEKVSLKKARRSLKKESMKTPGTDTSQKMILLILGITIICWIILPQFFGVDLAIIALIGGIVMVIVGGIRWQDVESKIPWGIVLLYGGAISMGIHLADSGGANWLADQFLSMTNGSAIIILVVLIVVTKFLTEVMSNTAAVSIMLPIGYGVAIGAGFPPEIACMLVGISGGLAFMFLISTPGNLISYSTGYFSQKDLIKVGVVANFISIAVVLVMAYTYWKLIGVW